MLEVLVPVIVGGVIAIAGGVVQAVFNSKKQVKQKHLDKREEAYLDFINALLKIEVDGQVNEVDTHDFWPIFNGAHAKLNLYGSKKIIQLSRAFQWHLQECCENHWDKGTEAKKWDLVDAIRKELKINN